MDSRDQPTGDTRDITWLDALEQCRQNLKHTYRRRRILYQTLLALIAVSLIVEVVTSGNWSHWYWVGVICFAFLMILSLIRRKPSEPDVAQAMLARLESSGLEERIKSGVLFNERIRELSERSVRWMTPALKGEDKVGLLTRVAHNTSWYVFPPRNHSGARWDLLAEYAAYPLIIWLALMTIGPSWFSVNGVTIAIACPVFMLITFAGAGLRSKVATLSCYLHKSWGASELEVQEKQSGAESEAAESGDVESLEEKHAMALSINLSETLIEEHTQHFGSFTLMLVVVFTYWLPYGLPQDLNFFGVPDIVWFFLVFAVGFWAVMPLLKKWVNASKKSYSQRLESSTLAERLLDGELSLAQLREHVPHLFTYFVGQLDNSKLPAESGSGLVRDIVRVGLTLGWYLDKPRTLVRPTWVIIPLVGIIGLFSVFAIPLWQDGYFAPQTPYDTSFDVRILIVGAICFGVASFITLFVDAIRTRAGGIALIEHLRERRK